MPMHIYSADYLYQKHLHAQVPLSGDTILLMDTLEELQLQRHHIHNWTSCDQSFSTVFQKVQNGWKGSTNDEL